MPYQLTANLLLLQALTLQYTYPISTQSLRSMEENDKFWSVCYLRGINFIFFNGYSYCKYSEESWKDSQPKEQNPW